MNRSEGDEGASNAPRTGHDEPMLEFYSQVGAWQHRLLYDDLVRFPKGRRRAERFRTLAFLGVLAEQDSRNGRPVQVAPRPAVPVAGPSAGGIFDEPLPE